MSKVSDEMLMAYADGELPEEDRAAVERGLVEDPALRAELEVQQRLKATLGAHYSPVMEEPLPSRLTAMLEERGQVIELAAARERKARRFAWPQLAAIAASLAVGVFAGQLAFAPGGAVAVEDGAMLARGELAETLQTRLASAQSTDAETRVGISFEDQAGRLCRTFQAPELGGIACREDRGWAVVMAAAPEASAGEYRQAGSALVMEQAQAMMAAEPLDAEAERQALRRGWRRAAEAGAR